MSALITALVTVSPLAGEFAPSGRTSKDFEVTGINTIECKQRALDMYGDYCHVTNCVRIVGSAEFEENLLTCVDLIVSESNLTEWEKVVNSLPSNKDIFYTNIDIR